jgi:nucleoid-associated protein EbfC
MSRRGGRYGGGGMGGMNPKDLMRQVQQMQSQMESIQEEANQEVIEVTAGGGMVSLAINGALEVQQITIAPEVVDPDDVEMLQDLVLAAVNEGIQKAQAMVADRLSAVTGGLGIPGL